MRFTRYRTTQQPTELEILFPKLESWNPMTEVATIVAEVNSRRVLCRVAMQLLEQKFRTSRAEPMQMVAENRTAIREAARRLIENESYEEDGSILIRERDL